MGNGWDRMEVGCHGRGMDERVGMKKWDEPGVRKKEVTEGGKEWKADGKREEMEEGMEEEWNGSWK